MINAKKKYSEIRNNEKDLIEVECDHTTLCNSFHFISERFTRKELDEFHKHKKIKLTKNELNIVNSLEKINQMCRIYDILDDGCLIFEDSYKVMSDIIDNNGKIPEEILKKCENIDMRNRNVEKWRDEQKETYKKLDRNQMKLTAVYIHILKESIPYYYQRFTKEEIKELEDESKNEKCILLTDHEIKVYNCMKWLSNTSTLKYPFHDYSREIEDGQKAICKCSYLVRDEIQMTGEIPGWLQEECKKRGKRKVSNVI